MKKKTSAVDWTMINTAVNEIVVHSKTYHFDFARIIISKKDLGKYKIKECLHYESLFSARTGNSFEVIILGDDAIVTGKCFIVYGRYDDVIEDEDDEDDEDRNGDPNTDGPGDLPSQMLVLETGAIMEIVK